MNTFNGRRILVVCKETYSYPLYFLAKKWINDNTVAAFFFNPCETKYDKCSLNEITYYAYKDIPELKLYTSSKIADAFTMILNSCKICDQYMLDVIERDYTHFQNINMQIVSSQFLTRHYHYRNYMHTCTYTQQLNWLILNYKNVISLINEFKPNVVLDTDNAEMARVILREVCYKCDIPYLTIDYPRYELYKLCSYNLNFKYSSFFYNTYLNFLGALELDLKEGLDYVENFRNKISIMHEMYRGDVTSQYQPDSIISSIRRVFLMARYFWYQDKSGQNRKIKRMNKILYPSSKEYIKFYFDYELNKQRLLRKNNLFKIPENVEYVYMPLHLIPESTTFSVSPMYVNEFTIIEAVSKSLPAGWWLYVKEHQAMVGERGMDFYKKVNKLPNVRMVQLNYYQDPKPWIIKSKGVITISGTSAYEAALLGKHSIVFADTLFSVIEGVERIDSFEKLPDALQRFKEPLDNKKSCAAYIEAVKVLGYSFDIKLLMKKGERILRGECELDDEYQKHLNQLEALFVDGYESFNERN